MKKSAALPGVLLLIAAVSTAHADDRGYLGVLAGFALPSPGSSSIALGVKGMYRLLPSVRTAIYYETFGSGAQTDTSTAPYVDATTRTTLIGGEATIHFFEGAQIGATAGYMKSSAQVDSRSAQGTTVAFDTDGSGLYLGPAFSYEVPVGRWTFGGDASYAFALSSSVPKALLLLASVKYWF